MGDKYLSSTSYCQRCGSITRNHALLCKRCRQAGLLPRIEKTDNERNIAILARAARILGLSYGQGIARYGAEGLLDAADAKLQGLRVPIVF